MAANGRTDPDIISNPSHYNGRGMECLKEMEIVFGIDAVISYCKCCIWKYRYREPFKGQSESDSGKADQYVKYLDELQRRKAAGSYVF